MILGGFYLGQRMGDLICLVWGAVSVGTSIILFALNVKETKGVDLENVVSD